MSFSLYIDLSIYIYQNISLPGGGSAIAAAEPTCPWFVRLERLASSLPWRLFVPAAVAESIQQRSAFVILL